MDDADYRMFMESLGVTAPGDGERVMDAVGAEALHLLSALEDALHLETGEPDRTEERNAGMRVRQALGAATTAQVRLAVDSHLRSMLAGWLTGHDVVMLAVRARVLLGLLHELHEIPGGLGKNPLAKILADDGDLEPEPGSEGGVVPFERRRGP